MTLKIKSQALYPKDILIKNQNSKTFLGATQILLYFYRLINIVLARNSGRLPHAAHGKH